MASPRKIAKLIQAGVDHFKAKQYVRAEGVLLDAVASDQCQHGALHLLGVLALQNGRNEIAIARWERALAVAPGVASYLSNLGEAHRRIGNYPTAVELLQQALASSPDLPEAHHNLGLTYEALGQWSLATEAFETALALKPEQLESLRRLARRQNAPPHPKGAD